MELVKHAKRVNLRSHSTRIWNYKKSISQSQKRGLLTLFKPSCFFFFKDKIKSVSPEKKNQTTKRAYSETRQNKLQSSHTNARWLHLSAFHKSSKGYVSLPYSTLKTSLISHFFASLASKITWRLWRVKRKLRTQITVPQGNFTNMGFVFSLAF